MSPLWKETDREQKKVIPSTVVLVNEGIGGGLSINTAAVMSVGEGDFSFSACLVLAFDRASNMVATSLNSKGVLYCMHIINLFLSIKPFVP